MKRYFEVEITLTTFEKKLFNCGPITKSTFDRYNNYAKMQ